MFLHQPPPFGGGLPLGCTRLREPLRVGGSPPESQRDAGARRRLRQVSVRAPVNGIAAGIVPQAHSSGRARDTLPGATLPLLLTSEVLQWQSVP